jgi:hypothetical protein
LANLTKTIINRIKIYSSEPTTKWNAFVWGTGSWGWRDVEWTYAKGISNSATFSTSQSKKVWHLISEIALFSITISREWNHPISETVRLSGSIASVYVINNGWKVTKCGISNAINWPRDNFVKQINPTTTWVETPSPTTTWV